MSITLYKKGESTGSTFTQSEPNLPVGAEGEFTIASVTAGTWIFYTFPNYNKEKTSQKPESYKKVEGGEVEVDIKGVNGSMFLVDEGIILFEHFGYGGERKWFQVNQANLSGLFPDSPNNPPSGISSAILLSKNRSVVLFSETDFGGKKKTMQAGEWCEMLKFTDDHQAGQNDKWLSFKFI